MMVDLSSITGSIQKFLQDTSVEHCNIFPTPTKFEAPLGTYDNGHEDKRYCPNSYASILGMILYIASNIRPYISFSDHQ